MKKLLNYKTTLLLVAIVINCFSLLPSAFSQIMIPPSPESSTLIRAVTHPADISAGIASVSYNLFTINSQALELPVTLHYNTSGVKLQDIPGCCGLSCYLSVGGKITRIVNQKPDESGCCAGDGASAGIYERAFNDIINNGFSNKSFLDAVPSIKIG